MSSRSCCSAAAAVEAFVVASYSDMCYVVISWNCVFPGTFKLKKMDYKKDGFNPSVVKDKLFYLDPKSGEYEELGMKAYTDIVSGQIRI